MFKHLKLKQNSETSHLLNTLQKQVAITADVFPPTWPKYVTDLKQMHGKESVSDHTCNLKQQDNVYH